MLCMVHIWMLVSAAAGIHVSAHACTHVSVHTCMWIFLVAGSYMHMLVCEHTLRHNEGNMHVCIYTNVLACTNCQKQDTSHACTHIYQGHSLAPDNECEYAQQSGAEDGAKHRAHNASCVTGAAAASSALSAASACLYL
jgi:hypothetical protein